MKFKRFLLAFKIAIFWGILIGFQQASSVIISSLHGDEPFNFRFFTSVSFLVVLACFLIIAYLFSAVFVLSLFKKIHKLKDDFWFSVLFGSAFGIWSFIFLTHRFGAVLGKSFLVPLILFIISILIAGFFVLGILAINRFFIKNNEEFSKILQKVFYFFQFILGITFIICVLILFMAGFSRLQKGRLGFVLKTDKKIEQAVPNIILVTSDALRADVLNPELMPEVSQFAEESISFSQAYTPAPWTLPSFSSFFSGKPPAEIGVSVYEDKVGEIATKHYLNEQFATFTEKLRDKGYLTQAVVANKYLSYSRGIARGFDGLVNLEDVKVYHWRFHVKDMVLIRFIQKMPFLNERVKNVYDFFVGVSGEGGNKTRADQVVDLSLEWLEKKQDSPFFLWLHFIDPHDPYDPPTGFIPKKEDFKEDGFSSEQLFWLAREVKDHHDVRWKPIDKEMIIKLYQGEVRYHDREIGRFFEYLKENDLYKDSLIVFINDHGEEFFEHGDIGHGQSLYQELVKAPLLVKMPDNKKDFYPQAVDKLISTMDFGPTVFSFLGYQADQKRDWFNDDYHQQVFVEGNYKGPDLRAVIKEHWKLIWDTYYNRFQLFNLKDDPQEKNNLADQYPEIKKQLQEIVVDKAKENRKKFEQVLSKDFKPSEDLGEVVGY